MKRISKMAFALLAVPAVMSLSSCLKNNQYYEDFSKVGTLVELPLAGNAGEVQSQAFNISNTPQTFQVAVNVASPKPLTSALTVTLKVDQSALDAYNATLDSASRYPILPAADYTIASLKVTVPANQRLAYLPIQVKSNLLDPSLTYALPITIADASGQQISNYKTLITLISAKNSYDGTYTLKGNITRNSATGPDATLSGHFSGLSDDVVTLSANANSFSQFWATGAGVAGIDGLQLSVNPTTNAVTVTASTNATLKNTTGYNSHYDPATQTFYLGFDWGTAPNTRIAVDTLTFKSSR